MSKKADSYGWRTGVREGFDRTGNVTCEACFKQKLIIDELREENQKLKQKVKKLKAGESSIPIGAHTPSSQQPFKGKSKSSGAGTRGGAQVGHVGSGRRSISKESADTVNKVPRPKQCEECKTALRSHSRRSRSVLEVSELKVHKVLYEIERGKCPNCRKLQESNLPLFRGALYGNALLSQVAVLHYLQGIPIGRICDMLGSEVKPGSIFTAMHRISKKWEPALESLADEYRKSPVKHADETGWRIDGQPGWSWLFCSPTMSLFECQDTRAARVPKRIFGTEQLSGVLVVDRFSSYNKLPCQLQYCYAHLLREVKKLDNEFPDEAEVLSFSSDFAHLLSEAMRLQGRSIDDKTYYKEAQRTASQIKALVHQEAKHQGIQSIQRIFKKNEARFFQWVFDRRVPAHNNRAERELRQTVIARKVSFGSQSERGAKTRSTLMSILATAKKRLDGSSVESWFKNALDTMALKSIQNPISLIPKNPP